MMDKDSLIYWKKSSKKNFEYINRKEFIFNVLKRYIYREKFDFFKNKN